MVAGRTAAVKKRELLRRLTDLETELAIARERIAECEAWIEAHRFDPAVQLKTPSDSTCCKDHDDERRMWRKVEIDHR